MLLKQASSATPVDEASETPLSIPGTASSTRSRRTYTVTALPCSTAMPISAPNREARMAFLSRYALSVAPGNAAE
jgi:hypothetical protein